MDMESIDYFIKVADARSLSNAAKLYRLPKSTLSHKRRAEHYVPRHCVEVVSAFPPPQQTR